MSEETVPKNPLMDLPQWLFILSSTEISDKGDARTLLLNTIKEKNMAPFYLYVCETLKETPDQALLKGMQEANKAELEKLAARQAAAISESEIRDAYLAKAEYLCSIGDKAAAESAFRETYDKTVALGQRMDVVFYLVRIGLFFGDNDLTQRNLDRADSLLKEGGDWDRRNRLKVYRGLYLASIRNFKGAAELFLDTISTFTSTELMEYKDFVGLSVLLALFALPRPDLKKKVVDGPEINEVLHELPAIKDFLLSFYRCQYANFFKCLGQVDLALRRNRYLQPHRKFYVREMRILAYTQLLESYRSVTLESMAKSFGVSVDFIDKELSRFVAAGRLNCKIDKVSGNVETNRPDKKNAQYQATVKQGDLLLNRIQKLSQVINI